MKFRSFAAKKFFDLFQPISIIKEDIFILITDNSHDIQYKNDHPNFWIFASTRFSPDDLKSMRSIVLKLSGLDETIEILRNLIQRENE